MNEQIKTYGKYAATAVVGVGLGFGGYATLYDTPVQDTTQYQNLEEKVDGLQSDKTELNQEIDQLQERPTQEEFEDVQAQVDQFNTTVTDKEERVANLESQVTQFNETVEELRAENADLEDAVATAQERVGLVDYLPVFSDEDVEFDTSSDNGGVSVAVDQYDSGNEGDYDEIDVNYESDDGQYDVTIREYEESEDAEDAVEDFEDAQENVVFTEDGDERTVEVSGYSGALEDIHFYYDDDDAVKEVNEVNDIESVVVDGDDITDRVKSVSEKEDKLEIEFESGYYVNEGETISVTYSDAGDGELENEDAGDGELENEDAGDGELENEDAGAVHVHAGSEWKFYDYDSDEDTQDHVFRDGNTVVEVEGTETGDEDTFEAQYSDLTSQYE